VPAARLIPILLGLAVACVRADDSPEFTSTPETEVIAPDDAWVAAEVHGDRAALERILHEDFLATISSGRTIDRTTFIDMVISDPPAPFTVSHESIRVHGDTALVIDLSANGKTKFTWIAIRRDGMWRVISETFSRVESLQSGE